MYFEASEAAQLLKIMQSRRDVRGNRFTPQAVEPEKLELMLKAAVAAPSVGYSQPWRFVIIDDAEVKEAVYRSFDAENEKAKALFRDRPLYNRLKLEGIREAPVNLAVLYEPQGQTLGQTSMEQVGEYSVVCAVQNMWLMARTLNLGMGWVSILDEGEVLEILDVPPGSRLVAYLCVGYVEAFAEKPELQSLGWADEKPLEMLVSYNRVTK